MDLLVFLGCTLLWFGGNWVVDGSSDIARSFKVSELVIGLSLVAIGTSFPEVLLISLQAWTNQILLLEILLAVTSLTAFSFRSAVYSVHLYSILRRLRMKFSLLFYMHIVSWLLGISPALPSENLVERSYFFMFIAAVTYFYPNQQKTSSAPNISFLYGNLLFYSSRVTSSIGGHFWVPAPLPLH